jgi:RNA polymerase sigma factor (sigma-70 family)
VPAALLRRLPAAHLLAEEQRLTRPAAGGPALLVRTQNCNGGQAGGNLLGMRTRAARSDRFEVLFRTHYGAVAGYLARRAEPDAVDDLVDEVFLVAWRRLDQVPAQARPWLLAVARNVLGTHIRGRRRGRALGVRLALAAADEPASAANLDGPGVGGAVGAALAALKPRDREALCLIGWEGLTPAEAAAVLGESPAAFRVRLHRARRRFRALIDAPEIRTSHPLNLTKESPHV